MCIICTDWQKGKLNREEAWRNLSERVSLGFISEEEKLHYAELADKLLGDENERSKL